MLCRLLLAAAVDYVSVMQKKAVREVEPFARGVAQSGVRIANERAVLTLVATNPGASNAELARLSGLGPQTTSRIVAELETRGLVMRGQVLRGRRGQPATPIFLDPHGAYTFGVEIGWRSLQIMLLDMSGKTIASVRRDYDWPDARTIFAEIAAEIATMRAALSSAQRARLDGVGVASPSFFERHIDRLGAPEEQLALWRGLDIAGRISADTGLPAEWFNDGSAACWAERISKLEPRAVGFAYLQVGTFVGAGIVVDGELWIGPSGHAANLGAIIVSDEAGKPTYVYRVASILAFEDMLVRAGQAIPAGSPLHWDWSTLEPFASQWLDNAGRALASALFSTRALVELDRAIIDGVLPRPIVERLLERVRHHIEALPVAAHDRPTVEMGHLGASAGATGAAQLMVFRRFFSLAWNLFTFEAARN